jgi:hypothetical protein
MGYQIGFELYSKGLDRVAEQAKYIALVAEKLAAATRAKKFKGYRSRLLNQMLWMEAVMHNEISAIKQDKDRVVFRPNFISTFAEEHNKEYAKLCKHLDKEYTKHLKHLDKIEPTQEAI